MENIAITAQGLIKRYGEHAALDGFDLEVPAGTVCGLLGPNGAGKTTAVRILTTLLHFDAGEARVAGFDVRREPARVKAHVGLVGQNAAVDEILSGRQNLVMFGRLYHLGVRAARRRADALLEQFTPADAADQPVGEYSGGMRRRLDLAAGLILAPPVLFLDEPTTGLDPRGRTEVWDAVRALVGDGTTVLLTTQYLEEADQLADAITVIDAGRVVAAGTPARLKARLGTGRLEVVVRAASDLDRTATTLAEVAPGAAVADRDRRVVGAPAPEGVAVLADAVRVLADAQIEIEDLGIRRPTLDEVFLHLTDDREVAST